MSSKSITELAKLTSGRALLIDWANQQDHWLRALVKEVVEGKSALTPEQIEHFYNMLLVEKELESGASVVVPSLENKDAMADVEQSLTLAQIKNIENVNLLAPGQELTFNPRITVIFGENAAGKSGYARILKRLAAVRTVESIHSDIRKAPAKPKATISYWLGADVGDLSKANSLTWNGEQGVVPLTHMDVFDSRGVGIHVDGELSYVYTPVDISFFPLVAEAVEQIKSKLEKARLEMIGGGNLFASTFNRQGLLYSKIETLGASTSVDELRKLADVSKDDEDSLPELEMRVDALRADSTDSALQLGLNDKLFLQSVNKCAATMAKMNVATYNVAAMALNSTRESYRQTSELAFANEKIEGVGSPVWSAFVESGEEYIAQTKTKEYPTRQNDTCIYCNQSLSQSAQALIKKYRDYCNNELKMAVLNAESVLQVASISLLDAPLERVLEDCTQKMSEAASNKEWIESVRDTAINAITAKDSARRQETIKEDALKNWSAIFEETKEKLDKLEIVIEELQTRGSERKTAFEDELKKLLLLKDRIQLRGVLPSIVAFVDKAKWADKANSVGTKFRGISKQLTDLSKIASEQLLNQDFEKLFLAECEKLKAPVVSVDFTGKKGQAARKKTIVSGFKLSDVLSEGEQKVIALADFIAESSLRLKGSPIILDDPVNSLDYKRLKHVVERIYDLSRNRQIIVFTHNIWFATELLDRFRKDKGACSYFDIYAEGEQRGIISPALNPLTDSFEQLKKLIDNLLKEAEKQSALEVKEALIRSAYEYMRAACEVFVETDLFQEVTKRYRANVMMTKLSEIRAERLPPAIETVTTIFDKCCDVMSGHSHGLETLNVRPSLDDIKKEWESLQAARSTYLEKQKSA